MLETIESNLTIIIGIFVVGSVIAVLFFVRIVPDEEDPEIGYEAGRLPDDNA